MLMLFVSAGPIQKMDPLNNLQVAIKNNIDIFYFSCLIPAHVLFSESGKMGKLSVRFSYYIICQRINLFASASVEFCAPLLSLFTIRSLKLKAFSS